MHREQALELTRIHSVAGLLGPGAGLVGERPFRAPHHSCSGAALIGGGPIPRPGELALAHHGVLFLDELSEFRSGVLDLLRQPLEDGEIWIHRSRQRSRFPCAITLVGASNPCACGWYGDPERDCRCSEGERRRYWARLSGPLLDRIDLQVVMRRPQASALAAPYRGGGGGDGLVEAPESTADVLQRVMAAHRRMRRRNPAGLCNGRLSPGGLQRVLGLQPAALELWEQALRQRRLTARAGERLLRVARTISDLDGDAGVAASAVAEALTYRSFDSLEQS
jgi:magnesium chelatase family protein